MKNQFLVVVLLSLSIFGCTREKPIKIFAGEPMVVDVPRDRKARVPENLMFKFSTLDLYQELQSLNLEQFKKFGTFYTNDFNIYHIKNLDMLEDNMYIGEIYLYFIDSTLHKIQAHTTKNMSEFFLSKYGGAKLVLVDQYNKDLVRDEGAIYRKSGKIRMNKNLSNYKLKWRNTDRLISYQVNETAQKSFEALEDLDDLDNLRKIKSNPKYVFSIVSQDYPQLLARVKFDEAIARRN